jgi:hypothetical protein
LQHSLEYQKSLSFNNNYSNDFTALASTMIKVKIIDKIVNLKGMLKGTIINADSEEFNLTNLSRGNFSDREITFLIALVLYGRTLFGSTIV